MSDLLISVPLTRAEVEALSRLLGDTLAHEHKLAFPAMCALQTKLYHALVAEGV